MKITIIVGTRPEIIKMAPVIRELERQGKERLKPQPPNTPGGRNTQDH